MSRNEATLRARHLGGEVLARDDIDFLFGLLDYRLETSRRIDEGAQFNIDVRCRLFRAIGFDGGSIEGGLDFAQKLRRDHDRLVALNGVQGTGASTACPTCRAQFLVFVGRMP